MAAVAVVVGMAEVLHLEALARRAAMVVAMVDLHLVTFLAEVEVVWVAMALQRLLLLEEVTAALVQTLIQLGHLQHRLE